MCDFPSWIETKDGEVYFLTDKDLNNPIFEYSNSDDMIGHSAIEALFPIRGKHVEKFPVHPEVAKAISEGKMNKMMRIDGYTRLSFDEDGNLHSKNDEPALENIRGSKKWYKNGVLHREGGPAIVYNDGEEVWIKNGNRHRDDGPAYISPGKFQYWYKNGKIHRENGPAVIYFNGKEKNSWYLNDVWMPRSKFRKQMAAKRAKRAKRAAKKSKRK